MDLQELYNQAIQDFNNQFEGELVALEFNECGDNKQEVISHDLITNCLEGIEYIELHGDMQIITGNTIVLNLDFVIEGNALALYFTNKYDVKSREWDEFSWNIYKGGL